MLQSQPIPSLYLPEGSRHTGHGFYHVGGLFVVCLVSSLILPYHQLTHLATAQLRHAPLSFLDLGTTSLGLIHLSVTREEAQILGRGASVFEISFATEILVTRVTKETVH